MTTLPSDINFPKEKKIFISHIPGLSYQTLKDNLPLGSELIKCSMQMTNDHSGIVCCYSPSVTLSQKKVIQDLFYKSEKIWFENENLLDRSVCISGCGPSYIAFLTEMFYHSALIKGFKHQDAKKLVLETLKTTIKELENKDHFSNIYEKLSPSEDIGREAINSWNKDEMFLTFLRGINRVEKKISNHHQDLFRNKSLE